MGSEIVKGSVAELPLWKRYANQFPVRENLIYLNHATVAPLTQRCADTLKHLADDSLHYGSLQYNLAQDPVESLGSCKNPFGERPHHKLPLK